LEVAHCGGKLTVTVATSLDGKKQYRLGYKHSSPGPAAITNLFCKLRR
jgi:hypothetical protein